MSKRDRKKERKKKHIASADRDVVAAAVEHLVRRLHGSLAGVSSGGIGRGPIGLYCLYWASASVVVLDELGIDAQIQAGTSYWPRLRRDQDDGKPTTPNVFGYEYTPGRESILTAAAGRMPEMHCWAASMDGILYDFTTRFWVENAARVGFTWPGDPPPPYLWEHYNNLPEFVIYRPDLEAIKIAYHMIRETR